MKVLQDLGRLGHVASVRGRFGGIRLARPAAEINVGAVVRQTEGDFDLVDCPSCVIAPVCGLSGALGQALAAFMAVLDRLTLADLLAGRTAASRLSSRPGARTVRHRYAVPAQTNGLAHPQP